jgi:hypothetical protein
MLLSGHANDFGHHRTAFLQSFTIDPPPFPDPTIPPDLSGSWRNASKSLFAFLGDILPIICCNSPPKDLLQCTRAAEFMTSSFGESTTTERPRSLLGPVVEGFLELVFFTVDICLDLRKRELLLFLDTKTRHCFSPRKSSSSGNLARISLSGHKYKISNEVVVEQNMRQWTVPSAFKIK